MPRPFEEWTVLPHSPIEQLDDNLLTVTGQLKLPAGEVPRRMTVARLSDGRLVVYSAIALDEPSMAQLERFGSMAYLAVPHTRHRMDVKIWKQRYPEMLVICPKAARAKVEELVPVTSDAPVIGDDTVRLATVPGTGDGEMAIVVQGLTGTTLVINELIFNLADRPGFAGWLFKIMGITSHEPHVPRPVEMRDVKDAETLAAQLDQWARLPNLRRILVSHGDVITHAPTEVLSRIAVELRA